MLAPLPIQPIKPPPVKLQAGTITSEQQAQLIPAKPHALSKEFQLYFQKVEEAVNRLGQVRYSAYDIQKGDANPPEIQVFSKLFNPQHSKTSETLGLFVTTLYSLESDAGIQKLLPYLAKFVSSKVSSSSLVLPVLKGVIQVTTALFNNQHIQFDSHLHQFIPAILTCILKQQLARDPVIENHWHLRDFSANLLSQIKTR